jgi:hypothetical protein
MCLSNLQKNIPNHYPELDLNFPPIAVNNIFKFQVQDSDLEYPFWRFENRIALSEKKLPLALQWTCSRGPGSPYGES